MEPASVDEEAKEAPALPQKAEKRLSFRQRMSFRANFTQGWSERVSGVIVARPRAILACMFAVAVLVIVGLAGVGVEVSVQTQYDWNVEDSVATIRRDMVEAADDDVDDARLTERSDPTYWWNFYYTTKSFAGKRTCDAPRGLFTPENVREICETEQLLLRRNYDKYCLLAPGTGDGAGECAPLRQSLAGFFYSADVTTLSASQCPLLSEADVDAVAARMYADRDAYGIFLDSGPWDGAGYACRARSFYAFATPLPGEDAIGALGDSQFDDISEDAVKAGDDLLDRFDMKESFMRSAYYKDARAGSPRMSVLWFSNFVLYEEWNFLVFSDLAFAVFSVIFVWIWIRVHVGSTVVATISMAQIVFSMPLSLFVYRVFLQITYFSPMQILAIFVILGIGADDVFVYSDAWHQSRTECPPRDGESEGDVLRRRVAFAYARALQAIFNTSFTTAFAFLATSISPIMPLHTFGVFAAIAILMNYGLVMTVTPAVWVLCDRAGPGRCGAARAGMASCCSRRCEARKDGRSLSTRFVEAYLRVVSQRRVALGLVAAMLCGGCALSVAASRLRPPNDQEEWLPPDHMFSRVLDLTEDGSFDAQRAQRYPTVSLLWGLDHLSRPKFVRYEPEKHRGDVHYSAPIRLHETAAQQQILYACDELRTSDGGALTRPGSTVCFLEEFQAWHAATYDGATTYDLGAETFDARLSLFRETTAPTNEVNVVASWKELIGFVDGELRFVRVDAKLSVIEEGAMDKKKRRLGQFNDLVDRVERAGGAEYLGDDLFHSSEAWVWYKTQTALVKGLLLGLSLAFPVAFAVLVLATQNVILATFAITSIGFIVSSVLGACYAMGWHLGVKESIAGVIVIGLAVDYTIHLGHMYDHARALGTRDREAKFEYAMRTMGETVVAGAITTAGSCSFLLACQLTFFTSMAELIVLTIALSLAWALLFFMPLLRVAGPEDDRGNVYAIFRACKDACHL